MRLVFLGGAGEVGASSLWCDLGGVRILVDAGIRLRAEDDPLPDLGRLAELGGVDAIVVTHAHLDHVGALPLVSQAFPAAPVYCTPATFAVLRVMLGDAVKVMEARLEREGEIPLYADSAVETALARVHPLPFGVIGTGHDWAVQFFPAGHVLGAAGVVLDGPEGRVVVSGDVSGEGQRTVGGCRIPPLDPRPDVLVLESTYGSLLHPSRRAEEERLAQAVAEVVLGGGKALVPAFALGRGQEVIFTLRAAQEQRLVPRFPIWVDGLVGAVCWLYADFADSGSRELRRRARQGDPFFDRTGWVTPVKRGQRERVLSAGPSAIVASSGMLTGGPSAFYATRLAPEARNAILLTGYQDEEAPGRQLLELAAGERKTITLGGQEVAVAARVGRYGLSAHADGARLAAMAEAVGARRVVLCHGEAEARRSLAALIKNRDVFLPANGETLEIATTRRAVPIPSPRVPLAEPSRQSDSERCDHGPVDVATLHERLLGEGASRHYALGELTALVYGSASPALEAALAEALDASSLFRRDPQRPYLFRTRAAGGEERRGGDRVMVDGRCEQNVALAATDSLLPPETGLYRKGAYPDEGRLLLYFHFPATARELYADEIARLAAETGWQVDLHDGVHQGELTAAARRALAPALLQREPSVHLDERVVRVRLAAGSPPPDHASLEAFREATGFQLELAAPGAAPATAPKAEGAWEQNFLLSEVDRYFACLPHRPYRKSLKVDGEGPYLELAFITFEVGERYAEVMGEISQWSGWRILPGREPNQQALIEVVRQVVPADWGIAKGPSIRKQERAVEIKVGAEVDDEEFAAVAASYLEATGYDLVRRR